MTGQKMEQIKTPSFSQLLGGERIAARTYEKLAQEIKAEPEIVQMFKHFARDEQRHAENLKSLITNTFGIEPEDVKAEEDQKIITALEKAGSWQKKVSISYLLERLSYQYYNSEAIKAKTERVEQFFEKIAREEADHAARLADVLRHSGVTIPPEPDSIHAIPW